jgi:signal transduction histidine kinase/CheY-like chemotaxis protein
MRVGKNLRFRTEMLLSGMAAVAIPFFITGGIVYFMLSQSLLDIYSDRSAQMAKDISTLIDRSLAHELQVVQAIAGDPDIQEAAANGDYSVARTELRAQFKSMNGPNMAFLVADRDGTIRADSTFEDQVGTNIADRMYFKRARNGQASFFGPVFARAPPGSGRERQPIVVVCAPIMLPDGFAGVVATAIEVRYFVDIMASTRIGRTGFAFLTDSSGIVIVHPRSQYILSLNMYSEPGMQEIARRIMRRETGAEGYTLRGTRNIAGFAPVESTGWTALFTQEHAEIVAPVNRILLFLLGSGAVFVAIVLVIMALLSRRVSRPVERMIDLLQQLTANSQDIIVSIGLDRRITYANPAAEKHLRGGSGTLVGTEPCLTNLHGAPSDEIWKGLEEGKTWTGVIQPAALDADPPVFTVMILPVRGGTGRVESYLEIGKDVTKEFALEARLRQSHKMEALGTMAGGIAHDFNNILTGIYGYTELCLAVDGTPAEAEEYIREIMQAADRARDLTRQILTFSRQTTLEVKAIYPKHIVREAVKLMQASLRPGIQLASTLGSDAVIMAEPTQVHQIIVNLCTNAIAAIGSREGRIEVDLADIDIDEEYARMHPGLRPGPHVRLQVSDTGSGIDPAIKDRIFDPFFTTKPQGEGTGLGLSVVHGIVRRLNGTISVYSEVGSGTAFTVLVPVSLVKHADVNQAGSIPARGTERVLLVDDEQSIVRTTCAGLSSLGYAVKCYTDSAEALQAFSEHPEEYDIVVTDNVMPRMTGLELARCIRERRPDLPIIISSGFFASELEKEAARLGIQGLLTKPLGHHELAAAIRKALAPATTAG